MAFAVQFPRYVQVENFRLYILYLLTSIAVLTWTVIQFLNARSYLEHRVPQGSVQFWASKWFDHEMARQSNAIDGEKEHCRNPTKFHYCYDAACGWDYKDFQCMRLCAGDVKGDCMHDSERWLKEDTGMFFPTYFNETIVKRTSLEESVETTRQWFVMGVESLSIGFDHEYFVENTDGEPERGKSSQEEGELYKKGIKTILRDSEGNEVQTWEPGSSVSLPIQTILDVGGIDLDTINRGLGQNFKKGAEVSDGMLTRISGVEFAIWMSYSNPEQHRTDWEGPICYLDISGSAVWTSKPALQVLDHLGSTRLRYKQGVRIRFFTAGSFAWVFREAIIAGFTSAIVFLGLAKKAVMLFSFHGLGGLSQVYKGIIVNRVNMLRECYGSVARLLSNSQSFVEVEDTTGGISRTRLYQRLRWLFKHAKELDNNEVRTLANVVFEGLKEQEKLMQSEVDQGVDAVGLQEYAMASSSNELVNFKSLVHLFDQDRPKGFLEKVFSDRTSTIMFTSKLQEDRVANGASSGSRTEDPEMNKEVEPVNSRSASMDQALWASQARCEELEKQVKDLRTSVEELQRDRKADRDEVRETIGLSLQAQSTEQGAAKELRSLVAQLQADADRAKVREKETYAELKRQGERLTMLAATRGHPSASWCSGSDKVPAEQSIVQRQS